MLLVAARDRNALEVASPLPLIRRLSIDTTSRSTAAVGSRQSSDAFGQLWVLTLVPRVRERRLADFGGLAATFRHRSGRFTADRLPVAVWGKVWLRTERAGADKAVPEQTAVTL